MDDIKPPQKPLPNVPELNNVNEPPEPQFVEPEIVAASESTPTTAPPSPVGTKKKRFSLNFKSWSRKKKIIVISALVLVLAGGGFGLYWFVLKPDTKPVEQAKVEPEPEPTKPTTEASRLSGVQISPELNKRSITAVMIENSMEARPQSGLTSAGVVFEAIAEGGITRYVAIFQEGMPDYIGPVRSARPYFIDWMFAFDPAYAHAGGSGEALSLIKSLGVKDLDHGANGATFDRVSGRYAPHNLYTSTAQLDAAKEKRGYNSSSFTSLVRKEKEDPNPVPTAKAIDINVSSANFKVHYDYVAATNSYNRVLGGKPHTDEKSGAQISPKVVVALVVPYKIHSDGVHSQYTTIGSGKAFVFQDGNVTEVNWAKPTREGQITFTDSAGNSFGLNPGQTWFTAVADAGRVTYTP